MSDGNSDAGAIAPVSDGARLRGIAYGRSKYTRAIGSMRSLSEVARALNGQVSGRQVLAPGPGHSLRDRSLSVRLSDASPDGFLVYSHAGDDFRTCRDHVAAALGLPADRNHITSVPHLVENSRRIEARRRFEIAERAEAKRLRRRAHAIWLDAQDPVGTIVEAYLLSRGLDLPEDVAGDAIRFHPSCPWGDGTAPAMVAAIRCVRSGAFIGIHRTALTPAGEKLGRKVFGASKGGAIMLDGFAEVSSGLTVGEGIETCLSGRQLGLRPVWSLVYASNIGDLPVLPGIEALTILAELDENKTNERACAAAGARWHSARLSVDIITPTIGKDLNDALRGEVLS